MNPIFGVEFSVDEMPEKLERLRRAQEQDNVEIEDTDGDDGADVFAAYYADGKCWSSGRLPLGPLVGRTTAMR